MLSSGTVADPEVAANPASTVSSRLRAALLLSPSPLKDFMTYWGVGYLFLTDGSPYSMSATTARQSRIFDGQSAICADSIQARFAS